MATVRYIVNDVEAAIGFYTGLLGFELKQNFGPAMAILAKDDLVLWVAGPVASAQRPMPDGSQPAPGGWNRFVVQVEDIAATVAALTEAGANFRNEIISGPGGQQILVEDPSGNAIEVFQPGSSSADSRAFTIRRPSSACGHAPAIRTQDFHRAG